MKKRIGSKLYDTEKGIPVLPEKNLYKQPNKRTFYLFDGVTIEPLSMEQAEELIRGEGDPDLESQYLGVKTDPRGCARIAVTIDHYTKLSEYSRRTGQSMKSLVEAFIDSLPES